MTMRNKFRKIMKNEFRMTPSCHAEFISASHFESQVRESKRDPETSSG